VYVPTAVVEHEGGHATRREPHRMERAHHVSAFRYLSRRYPRRAHAPLRLGFRLGLAARLLASWVSGRVAAGARFQVRATAVPRPPVGAPSSAGEDVAQR
jgi:N-acetylglucosaminyl-diphospho-decaprenol L-rhamnosyltransferase